MLILLHAAVPVRLHLLGGRRLERADDAEAEELGVGVIPDALGELRVLDLPLGTGAAAGGDAELGGIFVIPRAAARDVRVGLGGA